MVIVNKLNCVVSKGCWYVVGMWSVRGQYVVCKVDRMVSMWLVNHLLTTYRHFNLFTNIDWYSKPMLCTMTSTNNASA